MKKIIGIFVCMLLIVTAISATGATNIKNLGFMMEKNEFETYPSSPSDSDGDIAIKIVAEVTIVDDPFNLLAGAIQVGDKITGKYIYDSTTPDSEADPKMGIYDYTSTPYGIELEVGGFVFRTNPNAVDFRIGILNDFFYYYYGDVYAVLSFNNLDLKNGHKVESIVWWLGDSTGNALSSDALPTTAPVLSDWSTNLLEIWGIDHTGYYVYSIDARVTKATLSRSKSRDVHFTMQPILNWLFERFPNLFPILRQILDPN
jgi:hypothetical protein